MFVKLPESLKGFRMTRLFETICWPYCCHEHVGFLSVKIQCVSHIWSERITWFNNLRFKLQGINWLQNRKGHNHSTVNIYYIAGRTEICITQLLLENNIWGLVKAQNLFNHLIIDPHKFANLEIFFCNFYLPLWCGDNVMK